MRVGIVGCGHIGQVHLSYLMKTAGVAVVAVCDQDGNRAKQLAHAFGVPSCRDTLQELLRHDAPEVVHISTPPSSHASLAIEALESGCHVFIEKPFTLSLPDADEVLAVARRTGRMLCVDHSHLWDPPVLQAVRYLESGAIGELVGLRSFQGMSLPPGSSGVKGWFQDLPLGALHDVVPHSLAFAVRFIGTADAAHVLVQKQGSTCTEINLLARSAAAFASCTLSLNARPYTHTLELYGTKACVEIDIERMILSLKRERKLPFVLRKALPPLEESATLAISTISNTLRYASGRLRRFPGIGELISRFYRSLEVGEDPPVPVETAREVVRLTDILVQESKEKALCASL